MSLILDALRRSEEERKEQAEPMAAVYAPPARFERPSSAGLWLLLALLLAGFAGAVFWLLRESSIEKVDSVGAVSHPPMPPGPVPSSAPVSPPEPSAALAPGEAAAPVAEVPTRRVIPRSLEEESVLVPKPKAKVAADEPRRQPAVLAPVTTAHTGSGGAFTQPPVNSASEPRSVKKMSELPDAIRARLERFEVNTHFHSTTPGKSFALINMRKYREGEDLEGTGYRIRAITADGIEIDYGEGAVLLGMTRE